MLLLDGIPVRGYLRIPSARTSFAVLYGLVTERGAEDGRSNVGIVDDREITRKPLTD